MVVPEGIFRKLIFKEKTAMEPVDLSESNCCCVKIICSQCRHQRDLLQHDVFEDSNSNIETQVTEPVLDLNTGKWFLLFVSIPHRFRNVQEPLS